MRRRRQVRSERSEWRSTSHQHDPAIVLFWTTGAKASVEALEELARSRARLGEAGAGVLAVSLDAQGVDAWIIPVTAVPNRSPTCSVANETIQATPASAMPATTKAVT